MDKRIKTTKIGKLRIYLQSGETVQDKRFIRKLFPKNKFLNLLNEAKNAGIRNAHIYHTHSAYEQGGTINHYNVELNNKDLTVCMELIDEKEKLELFFSTHENLLKNKTVIYKEVESWEYLD